MAQSTDAIRAIASAYPGLKLLVLHGSRARGDSHAGSDWDFAYSAEPELDVDSLMASLGEGLGTNHLDLADLDRASGLLRYKAASDGVAVYQREPALFEQFRLDAVSAWCDMAPVLGPAYAVSLARLVG